MVLVFIVPIGVGTAIYLEEYADKTRWYNRLIELNIQNLAAVPSIVYGILGLAFLVRGIGLGQRAARRRADPDAARPADRDHRVARSDPRGPRHDPPGWLRARRDPVAGDSRQVLPAALPGIATGSILSLSRGIGETAPLIMVGAVTYVAFDPTVLGPFTALPIQIYQWLRLPQEEFRSLAAAAIIVLLGILLSSTPSPSGSDTAIRGGGDERDRHEPSP